MRMIRLLSAGCVACFAAGVSYTAPAEIMASMDAGGNDSDVDPLGVVCGGKRCPTQMVCVPHPTRAFCIDPWEASVREYQNATLTVAGQDPRCTWNTSFKPAFATGTSPDLPVVGIDFCDALAYCKARGKRLCQKVSGRIGAPASEGEWYNACSEIGTRLFPYGGVVSKPLCVIGLGTGSIASVRQVGVASKCEGGYPGLYEMIGNVHEWVDRTTSMGATPQDDGVSFVGGAWGQASGDTCLTLASAFGAARAFQANDLGVRCCADPL
jgi:formylglycine-generating enzyme